VRLLLHTHRLFTYEFILIISIGTTDTVFLEKPQYYDLVIDMTTFSPERASRPDLQLSVREPNGSSRRPLYRLSTIRFTWSDVKLVRPDPNYLPPFYNNASPTSHPIVERA
jgi:hypothetical protein